MEDTMSFELNIKNDREDKTLVHPNSNGGTEQLYRELKARIDPDLFDKFNIIPSRVREDMFDDRPTILWLHDLPEDPESAMLANAEYRKKFDKIVFVSNWQRDAYNRVLGVPLDEGVVIKNAIEPIMDARPDPIPDQPIRLTYFSTPHRGLSLLYPALHVLRQHRQDFTVDIYSSFELYGWKDNDAAFQELFDKLSDIEDVRLHGTVMNAKLRNELIHTDILAYPSIYQETSCRVLIESMCAGLLPVIPNYAALTETACDFAFMYEWSSNPQKHVELFTSVLNHAMDCFRLPFYQNVLKMQRSYYQYFYGWDLRAAQWTAMLTKMLENK
jgi:glycosyltransferase involved in cell wall biosynthesis